MHSIYLLSAKLVSMALVVATQISNSSINAHQQISRSTPAATVIQTSTAKEISTSPPAKADLNSLTNQYRSSLGLSTLASRGDLCELATKRVRQIENDFSHQGFRDLIDQGSLAYLGYSKISENIWQGSSADPLVAVSSWDQSPSHQQALQDSWTWGCGAHTGHHAVFMFMR